MATKIPYLILQEKHFEPYSIVAIGLFDNLLEDGTVQNLLDHAASKIPSHIKFDVSQQVVMEPTVYTLIDPIPTFIGRPRAVIAQELGVIDKAFLDRRAGEWPSEVPLSQLGIKKEGNVGQLLVVFTLTSAESSKDVDRSLAFVQADPSTSKAFVDSPPQLQPRSTPTSQAPSPAKRHADLPPPTPSRRQPYDMSSSKSEPASHNPFASSDLQSQAHPQPPLHPSQRSESSRSLKGSHNPFVSRVPPPPKSEDGNVKLPPLPPRKPPPPIPPSLSSTAPPPPPRRHSRVDRSLSPSKLASLPMARSNGPPPPPPKLPQHVTSTLMKESLHASKIAQSMKRAEEHLEKERVMQVLKSSSSTPSTGGATFQHASYSNPVRRTASPVRTRGYDVSSASSASESLERSAPPLPRRRHTQQQPSPPMSASSLEQVALAAPPQSYRTNDRAKERDDYTLSPFRSPIDPISTSVPPTTDRPSDGEYSPVRSGPPPTHPDRKPYFGAGYNAPTSFEAVYGGMESPLTPVGNSVSNNEDSPTGRMFRSKSMHHPSSPAAHALPPPVRRRRPESVQVLGSVGTLVQAFSPPGPSEQGAGLSRHASLARPGVHRRSSLSVSSTPVRDVSPTRNSAISNSSGTTASNPGSQSPLSSLQRTFATLQPKLDALAPRLDKARYKAEAGFSRRGFIPSGGGTGVGAGREEKEGLMGPGGGDGVRRGRRGTVGSGRGDQGEGFDGPEVDDDTGSEGGEEDTEWQRSRGMRRGLDDGRVSARVAVDRGGSSVSGRSRNVFEDGYDREGEVGGAVSTEQDNLKWPAGEGWKPL